MALLIVALSVNSKFPPIGIPLANFETVKPNGFISLVKYITVVSPSKSELKAKITSSTDSFATLFKRDLIFSLSGVIPFNGAIFPFKT